MTQASAQAKLDLAFTRNIITQLWLLRRLSYLTRICTGQQSAQNYQQMSNNYFVSRVFRLMYACTHTWSDTLGVCIMDTLGPAKSVQIIKVS